jgi:2,3,4,5-tetrahydropyridine-2-carboxylate N-succinyltransferase
VLKEEGKSVETSQKCQTESNKLEVTIEEFFQNKENLSADALAVVEEVIAGLDNGSITVVEPCAANRWKVNAWVKKAILLYFRLRPVERMPEGNFVDKVPLKDIAATMNRVVPYASIRKGSYLGPKVVVMAPSFINIGAYVDEGAMVDSLVLVGSCARIGKNVHLGAGTIIGGVLEPPNSSPVIVEDGAFVGGSCGLYEGIVVEKNAVIAAGTIITAGTPILDLESGEEIFGRVPENAVVVPGGRPKTVKGREIILQTPVIIKKRDPRVDAKLVLEDSLRVFG